MYQVGKKIYPELKDAIVYRNETQVKLMRRAESRGVSNMQWLSMFASKFPKAKEVVCV
jgi:hypothetical protein